MRTITAPGVEIKEIDKSGYSPAMTGTTCFLMGFTNKGEPYQRMEFTGRSALVNYYGEPDNEAERYFYNAATEVLNQNGRLYTARLPYDNEAFEKLNAFKYSVKTKETLDTLKQKDGVKYGYPELSSADNTIDSVAFINGSDKPYMLNLSDVDAYRTDEEKVASDTFIIVDKTAATYKKIPEDKRKGIEREVLGIVPVITTAANGLYAQSMINVSNTNAKYYESLGYVHTQMDENNGLSDWTLSAWDKNNSDWKLSTDLKNHDLIRQLNTIHKNYKTLITEDELNEISTINNIFEAVDLISKQIAPSKYLNEVSSDVVDGLSSTGLSSGTDVEYVIDEYNKSVGEFEKLYNNLTPVYKEHIKDLTFKTDISGDIFNLSAFQESATIETAFITSVVDENNINITGLKDGQNISGNLVVPSKIGSRKVKSFSTEQTPDKPEAYSAKQVEADTIETWSHKITVFKQILSITTISHASDGDDSLPDTVSLEANTFFPPIEYNPETASFDREDLKKIGVVVYKTYIDPSNGNKVAFEPVEAFVGSLNKNDKDPNTGITTFLDTIINSQSQYIYFFSNCFSKKADKKIYEDLDIYITSPCDDGGSLGFFSKQTVEDISVDKSILDGMNKCFEKSADINEIDIDIVPDAGISNIAAFLKSIYPSGKGQYDLNVQDSSTGESLLSRWKMDDNNNAVKIWKSVIQKLDTFCKKTRKDCMFIADGPRPLVLQGQKKVVRPSKPTNSIDVNILPYLKFITGLNTNYGAGYLDWFQIADEYTGDFFWLPPSIKAMGIYINTDTNFKYWDAPAGLNRGMVQAVDVAFSPNGKQAGAMYEKNWNYSINYPTDGIVLEGQKTFQVKPSAFDRVNVRRLFLRLERAAFKTSRYFCYEGNTAYTRQKLVDALDPYFKEAKVGGGIYEYRIICDETNNPPEVIDRNELSVKIGIKPTKTAEFILIDFIAVSTGGSFEEAMA